MQAMRAERDAMVAAGLAPASLTDIEASHFFLHVNGNSSMQEKVESGLFTTSAAVETPPPPPPQQQQHMFPPLQHPTQRHHESHEQQEQHQQQTIVDAGSLGRTFDSRGHNRNRTSGRKVNSLERQIGDGDDQSDHKPKRTQKVSSSPDKSPSSGTNHKHHHHGHHHHHRHPSHHQQQQQQLVVCSPEQIRNFIGQQQEHERRNHGQEETTELSVVNSSLTRENCTRRRSNKCDASAASVNKSCENPQPARKRHSRHHRRKSHDQHLQCNSANVDAVHRSPSANNGFDDGGREEEEQYC
jgi:hypothetical protein